jgi:hypothetical protein
MHECAVCGRQLSAHYTTVHVPARLGADVAYACRHNCEPTLGSARAEYVAHLRALRRAERPSMRSAVCEPGPDGGDDDDVCVCMRHAGIMCDYHAAEQAALHANPLVTVADGADAPCGCGPRGMCAYHARLAAGAE